MHDTTASERLAARATLPLLLLAGACLAMPILVPPGGGAASSGLALAGPAHPEMAVAAGLLAIAVGVSLTRVRHRISLLVLASGFATAALLLLKATLATGAQETGDRLAAALGGQLSFGPAAVALQRAVEVRWTAAYWAALLAAGAVFLLNSWALLRRPEAPPQAAPTPQAQSA
jgi:hypothetical protein